MAPDKEQERPVAGHANHLRGNRRESSTVRIGDPQRQTHRNRISLSCKSYCLTMSILTKAYFIRRQQARRPA